MDLLQTAKGLDKNHVSESKPGTKFYSEDDTEVVLNYWGKEATGIMASWCPATYLPVRQVNPAGGPLGQTQAAFGNLFPAAGQSPMFLHVTQTKFLAVGTGEGLGGREINATGDDKEFGAGFYSMPPEALANGDCGRVGANWFKKPGQKWCVMGFQVPKMPNYWGSFIEDAAGRRDVADLVWYLTTSNGHLRGGANPNAADIAAIERINLRGKALIFPSDDSKVAVAMGQAKMCASDVSNQQGANLPGNPWVVCGPQRPPCMLGTRQVVWRYGLGMWLMNSAVRHIVYRDA